MNNILLLKITTRGGEKFYIVSNSIDASVRLLKEHMDSNNIGEIKNRAVKDIKIISEEVTSSKTPHKNLILDMDMYYGTLSISEVDSVIQDTIDVNKSSTYSDGREILQK